ncbi:MAG: SDR family NAD(P)-dependent oxidoreductase [Myxococcales bacterium]|nr:MAG: SDR family NAD(P)-dependent oxidoreductase [Myxococcales bacterium]
MKDVKGRWAVVTGGAAGMGRLWAEHLIRDGANVALWDINAGLLEKTAQELRVRGGGQTLSYAVDVSDREAIYKNAEKVQEDTGGVDILINNAGIVYADSFLDTPDERLSRTIDVNLKALMWTMKAFLPRMVQRNEGHVVNVSSASGFVGVPRMPAYTASKWGVIGLSESLRLEMELIGKKGVKFTTFCPSYVDTGMFEGARAPLLTPMLKPHEAVALAYEGFKKDQPFVLAPAMVKITPALKWILPTKVFDFISHQFGVTSSMSQWKGHGR